MKIILTAMPDENKILSKCVLRKLGNLTEHIYSQNAATLFTKQAANGS